VQDWISLVIHGVALYFLAAGFKVLMDHHNIEWNAGLLVKVGACVALLASLGAASFFALRVNAKQSETPAESWVKDAVDSWPQLVLTHDAKFRGHSGLNGATAFLVRLPNGDTAAATARHLLGAAGGVSPELKATGIDSSLMDWRLHPRGKPGLELAVSGLYGAPAGYLRANEW
jgi:hypothetical protein